MITYTDKVQLTPNANPDINVWRAVDANEIKSVVNTNETALGSKVPTSRILTIDGVPFDLSADRTWTTSGGTDKFPNIYNVTLNGLVADGVTDNSAALTTLIAAATAGAWFYFPDGTYNFVTSVVFTKKIHLVGDGVGSALITAANNIVLFDYDYTGNAEVSDVLIRDIRFHCLPSVTPVSGSIGLRIANSSSRVRIERVYVGGFYSNIAMTNAVEYGFDFLYCTEWVEAGLDVRNSGAYADAGDGTINNSWFIPATYDSIYSIYQENGGGLKISNTKFNYQASPIHTANYHYYYEGTEGTTDLNIGLCSFENYSLAAIRIGVSGAGTFKEISIGDNDFGAGRTGTANTDGILLTGVDNGAIIGNTFLSAASGTDIAITLTNCDRWLISNVYEGWATDISQSGCTEIVVPVVTDASISPTNDDILQRKSGAWINRTLAQLKTDLALITQTVTNGVTTTAPSEDAVFDAIASAVASAGYVEVTGAGAISASDLNKTILCSGTSTDYALTLPTAVGNKGQWYDFVGVAGLTKVVTVDANSTETINGLTVNRPFTGRGGFKIVSDGANWQVVDEKPSWILYVPTFTGFSGTPTSNVKYSLMGKQMTIAYLIVASAASGTGLTFNLPTGYTSTGNFAMYARVMSNGTNVSTGMALTNGTNVELYLNGAGGAIAATSNKAAEGVIVFEIT